ncbi:transcriptional regulator GcvA [Cupriavidus consociatus]|uniref:transcriptional regulator GcvA n=1 Tax=Cupriavidus consociatus TaxID=2821357 RepID=UPI001AEB486C|nr:MULTISPECIES: transcriptional regulator GcvA [unclassified Cupriavidus]MBP0624133.1 transcriptional regulator GcvA [Cupriavidus sp. LEh25]MDK2660845.1 transcriptional regulator GcvA [Cupriavidus sp. LEh21]
MFDRLPPLQTLRAFEATGRLLSMTLAAEELHVTHGAVSRHIKMLESYLGVVLFRRLTRRIVLTEAGAEFHASVARLLGELTREAERLRTQNSVSRLKISTSVSFASKWLAPRLHRLKARHPELDVHLDVTDVNVDLNDGQVDAAIRYGNGRYRNVVAERILEETVTPVCSPAYLAAVGGLPMPGSLVSCTLLHEDRMLANWEHWFALAGVDRAGSRRGPAYSHGSMAIEAAIRDEGVVLGRSALVADDIAAGRLVAPFPNIKLKAERGYDLVYRTGNHDNPKVRVLRDWLAEEIRMAGGG